MKKVMILGVLMAGVYLASCNTNEVTPTDSTTITASAARTAATDSAGKKSSKDSIAISALPVVVTNYIKTTYPTATIHRAAKRSDGTYTVIIDISGLHKGLKFDANGIFVSEFTRGSGGHKDSTHAKGTHTDKDSTHTGGGKKNKKGKG